MPNAYLPIMVLITVATLLALVIVVLTHIIGPARRGEIKDAPYESGMPIIGDARRRFNVRFYIIAMLFLLFDVEVVLLWPCVMVYRKVAGGERQLIDAAGMLVDKGLIVGAIGVFVGLLLWGYLYDMRRGVLQLD